MKHTKIVISDDRFGHNEEELLAFRDMPSELVIAGCNTEDDVICACKDADAVLLNQAPMSAKVIGALEKCKVISRYGIGYDNVDIKAAERKGIWVTNVPGYCTEEVAEHALGMLLCCVRRIPFKDRSVREGKWNLNQPIRRMSGRTLGIIGFGSTGRAFWEKVQGFGFKRILINDPCIEKKLLPGMFGEAASFEKVIAESDFISLHVPLKDATRHLIDRRTISLMKNGVIIINISRGSVIDEAALFDALTSGKIASAGLDVFEKEPLAQDHPFLSLDNVILSDHSAYYSEESVSELKMRTAINARDILEGKIPKTAVNCPSGFNIL